MTSSSGTARAVRPLVASQRRSFAKSKRRPATANSNKKSNKEKRKGAHHTKQQQNKMPKRKIPKQPKGILEPARPTFIPTALLLPTASPYAYVSMAAFDEEDGDPRPLAKTLFDDIVSDEEDQPQRPPFQGMAFHYFSPKSFKHELPKASDGKGIPEVAFLGRSNVGTYKNPLLSRR